MPTLPPSPSQPPKPLPATVIAAFAVRERLTELLALAEAEGAGPEVLGPLRDAWDDVDQVVEGLSRPAGFSQASAPRSLLRLPHPTRRSR